MDILALAAKNNLDGGRGGSGRGRGHPGSGRGGRGEHRREYNVACDRSRDQYDVRSHYRRDHGGGLGLVRGEHCVGKHRVSAHLVGGMIGST